MRIFKVFAQVLLFLFYSMASYGEPKSFLAKDIQALEIEGLKPKIVFQHKNSAHFQIEWNSPYSVKMKKAVLEIKDSSYRSKSSWSYLSSKKETVLKITGPSRPVSVFSSHLKAHFTGWRKPVFISSHQAKISGDKNSSSWQIFSKKSEMDLKRQTGNIHFKGFSLKATLKNFSKIKSHFYFNDGYLKMIKGSGKVFFATDEAQVHIKNFKGDLVGTTRSGSVNASVKADKRVDVFSEKGDLRFYFEKAGAQFFAYTEKGKIQAPSHMYKEYSGKSIKVVGRMKGNRQGNKISLKTDTGSIYAY